MKLLSSYFKEMKIASRGFYFYVEIIMALIMLTIILVAIKENPDPAVTEEFLFLDSSFDSVPFDVDFDEEETEFELKACDVTITNEETGKEENYSFEKETIRVATAFIYDDKTGDHIQTLYKPETYEDFVHLTYSERTIGVVMSIEDNDMKISYYLQGYETDRMVDLLRIININDVDQSNLPQTRELSEARILNPRENILPVFIAFTCSLMGFFIVMAYIFLDKNEGVIKAFCVAPSSITIYLISKIMVLLTTVIISATIITIPVVGFSINYALFYLLLLTSTFAFTTVGLLIASYFDSITKSFGVLYLVMIVLMLPGFSYYIPSFDPTWMKFLPTYHALVGFKDILLRTDNPSYVLVASGIFLASGLILLFASGKRYKKTLGI